MSREGPSLEELHIQTRQRLVEALALAEERYRNVVENLREVVFQTDATGNWIFLNKAWEEVTGFSVADSLGTLFLDYVHPDDRERNQALFRPLIEREKEFCRHEVRYLHKRGGFRWIEVHARLTLDEEGAIVGTTGTLSDVTTRRAAEEKARKLSEAVEQSGEAILITDAEGRIEYVNSAFVNLTGYREDEVLGGTARILKSGMQDAAFYADLWKSITAGENWRGRLIEKRRDGSLYPASLSVAPIRNEAGDITHFVGHQEDLSQYEALQEQARQAQKLEAVGILAGGIAHDFNNTLAGLQGNIYLARQGVANTPEVLARLERMGGLTERAAQTISKLLTFARKGAVQLQPISLTACLAESLELHRLAVPESILLLQDLGAEELRVNGDAAQLQQLLLNLLTNARDAVESVHEPTIQIKLEGVTAEDAFLSRHPDLSGTRFARLSVADNGSGISVEHREHIFDPFFTTKEVGKGTGLGLAMVYGSVQTHGGVVELEGYASRGTVFSIYLPLLDSEGCAAKSQQQDTKKGRGEGVLLADDEPSVLEVCQAVLESLGYRVFTARDGLEALEVFKAHSEEIELALLDMVMPKLGGFETALRLRELEPDLKIIFATGYQIGNSPEEIQTLKGVLYLEKPYSVAEVSLAARALLEA